MYPLQPSRSKHGGNEPLRGTAEPLPLRQLSNHEDRGLRLKSDEDTHLHKRYPGEYERTLRKQRR